MGNETEVKKSICYFCHCMCAVELHIKDGRLEKVEEDKDSPDAKMLRRIVRGCPRSRRVADFVYHPDRLSFPLKRVGERGEGR